GAAQSLAQPRQPALAPARLGRGLCRCGGRRRSRIRLLLPGRPLDRLVLLLRLRLLCLVLFAKTPHGQVLSFVRSVAPRGRGLYSGTAGILSSLARSAALPTPREVVY